MPRILFPEVSGEDSSISAFIPLIEPRAGLVTASDPLNLFAIPESPRGVFVFKPTGNKRQRGFVAVALHLAEVMKRILSGAGSLESGLSSGLFQLKQGEEPVFLTGFPPGHSGQDSWHDDNDRLRLVVPVFVFGKTYALHFHPDGGWLAAHPLPWSWPEITGEKSIFCSVM